ncbi:MAG: UDP-N-acetylmuramate--L-alanine ligase [Proteobacteria bacterium]|nr:UDP-N-acetylmuramate--L-alanine ligase [Pseudomonadota bacterium]
MNFQDLKTQSKIHFIGLGGIGMSALAFILRELKIPVQGSDLTENYLTQKLRDKGAVYFVGHKAENISDDVSLIVETSIIKSSNPEIIEAQKRNIPIITRANLLAMIMREFKGITIAGTHGKTSTTGMVSLMLEINGLDPTVVNGGIIHYFNSNSKVGKGEYLVAESDESDASFVNLPSFIGAVTNIEAEHLEFSGYGGSFEKQKSYFEQYINQIPNEGICVLCIDSPEVEKIYDKLKSQKKNLVTYSINKDADFRAKNISMDISGLTFDVVFKSGREIKNIKMPIYGKHNASNALVAIAIGDFFGFNEEQIKKALVAFNGVRRRFTKVGEYQGAAIIDDYGHHPTEISTTLKAARQVALKHKVICVFQAHKYSRVRDLLKEFGQAFFDCDCVIVSDIYSAGQEAIAGINQDTLIAEIKKSGHQNVIKLNSEKDLAAIIKPQISAGDIVFFTGAGTVTYWAAALADQLKNS